MRRRIAVFLSLLLLPGLLHAQRGVQQWRATRDLRIGSVDDSTTSLTYPGRIAFSPAGEVYVPERQDNSIRVFDARGRYLRTVGRKGGGPGEFEGLATIGFLGDTLYATDFSARRVTFFSAAGKVLHTEPLSSPQMGDFIPTVPTKLLHDGTAVVMPSVSGDLLASGRVTRLPMLKIDRSGHVLDTIVWQPVTNMALSIRGENSRYFTSQPFSDDPINAWSPDGQELVTIERRVASKSPAQFRMVRVNARGDTLFSGSYSYVPERLPRSIEDSIIGAAVKMATSGPHAPFSGVRQAEAALRKALFIPKYLITVDAAVMAQDGALWLLRNRAAGKQWDVYDRSGTLRATVALPPGFSLHAVRPDGVWGVERDELDVAYIVRYRLTKGT